MWDVSARRVMTTVSYATGFGRDTAKLAAALQFTLQAALQRWLGDVIDVGKLEVSSEDATLRVDLSYTVRASGDTRSDSFVRSLP